MNKKRVILLIAVIGIAAAAFAQSSEAKEAFDRGRAASNAKNYDQAIAEYTEAIRLNPNYANAYNNRGNVYNDRKRDYDRAIADYTEAVKLEPSALRYDNRGLAYYNKKDYARAIADYEAALRLDPNLATNAKKFLAEAKQQLSQATAKEQMQGVELWEGIYVGMTKDQALAKAREVFQVTRQVVEQSNRSTDEMRFDLPKRIYPQNYTSSLLLSTLAQYERDYYLDNNLNPDRNRPVPNVHLHFSDNKLFGILIKWGIPYSNLLAIAERKYGKPTDRITLKAGSDFVYTVFETSEILVYCLSQNNKFITMCIISKEILKA